MSIFKSTRRMASAEREHLTSFAKPLTLTSLLLPSVNPAVDMRPRPIIPPVPMEDRRAPGPDASVRSPAARSRAAVKLRVSDRSRSSSFKWALPHTVQFVAPRSVALCVKRRIRKEVLHSLQRTGKGRSSRRRKHRNFWSEVGC